MDESSFDESELSPEDLEILRAFDAMEGWNTPVQDPVVKENTSDEHSSDDEMLVLFVSEVEEDLARMQRALGQVEQDDHIDPARFVTLKRVAHKVRGTAGAVEYHGMATIAHAIEVIVEKITGGQIFPLIGVNGLTQAMQALEVSLRNIALNGKEGDAPLAELEAAFARLNINLQDEPSPASATGEALSANTASQHLAAISPAFIRVDPRRVERLIQHSEHLAELHPPLENAQMEIEITFQELHAAQERLRQLQSMLSKFFAPGRALSAPDDPTFSSSSLITRILNESGQRNEAGRKNRASQRPPRKVASSQWDELDMERYSEKDRLMLALNEAISDVMLASARVQAAFAPLNARLQEYVSQVSTVRSDVLLLRLAPLSILIPRLERAIMMSAMAQERQVNFEVKGEDVEVDQDILELLTTPLLQMVRTCIADILSAQALEGDRPAFRIWFYAHCIGNEVTLEIGFSMTVNGGALEVIRGPLQQINGTYSLQRNGANGVSFYLRFPRSHGTTQCLLVRAGDQRLIVPFSQVQRIGEFGRESLDIFYNLGELLGFPESENSRLQPILLLPQGASSRMLVGVAVDEVLGAMDLVVKPLKGYLRRPGIAGAAIDGKGSVLLMLDLLELVRSRHHSMQQAREGSQTRVVLQQRPIKILVADDSASLRQSVLQTLRRANYLVREARDGMEALEQMLEDMPDIFLLDIEMPNLNGYDLLGIMSLYPELANVKVIMLTSRTSEKHRQLAREMGACAYLTKPCSHEILLATIQGLLAR